MPSRRFGGYRFFFYMQDLINEPIHFHVEHKGKVAKFWLEPIQCEMTGGIKQHDLNDIEAVIKDNQAALNRFWHTEKGKL